MIYNDNLEVVRDFFLSAVEADSAALARIVATCETYSIPDMMSPYLADMETEFYRSSTKELLSLISMLSTLDHILESKEYLTVEKILSNVMTTAYEECMGCGDDEVKGMVAWRSLEGEEIIENFNLTTSLKLAILYKMVSYNTPT